MKKKFTLQIDLDREMPRELKTVAKAEKRSVKKQECFVVSLANTTVFAHKNFLRILKELLTRSSLSPAEQKARRAKSAFSFAVVVI